MIEAIDLIIEFFYNVVATSQSIERNSGFYFSRESSSICTFPSSRTDLRKQKQESIPEYLQRRYRSLKEKDSGGLWLGDFAVFDFALDFNKSNVLSTCDCSFYCIHNDKQTGLRYEVDLINTGQFFVDHPCYHLQWDSEPDYYDYSVFHTRTLTNKMYPTEFFEFCIRHFRKDIWFECVDNAALILSDIKENINKIQNSKDRKIALYQVESEIDEQIQSIKEFCIKDKLDEFIQLPDASFGHLQL